MPENLTTQRRAWAELHRGRRGHIRAEVDQDVSTATLYLYDPIDSLFGIAPADIVAALQQLGDVETIQLHINSPGGDVFDALAILNTLRQHPARVVAHVDGIAASSASFIAAGADELVMSDQAMLYLHDAWAMTIGNEADHRATADILDKISNDIAAIYAAKAGGDVASWRQVMRDEAWYTDAEAVDAGLADRVAGSEPEAVAAALTWSVQGVLPAPIPPTQSVTPAVTHSNGLRPAAQLTITEGTPPMPESTTTTTIAAVGSESTPLPAAAPSGMESAAGGAAPGGIANLSTFYAALAALHSGRATPDILNVLQDITQTAVGVDVEQPAFVGELWSGVRYQRKVVPLIAGERLTSYKIDGWRWTTKPVMAPYSGDKADVPSNAVGTEPASASAQRLAGAHDIDRKFVDFGDSGFFAAYYAAMAESYAILSDGAAVDAVEAAATDYLTPTYTGFLGAIAYGVQQVSANTGADSTFVLANSADLIPWALGTTNQDLSAFLDLIGVDPSRIVHHPNVTAGHVIVGTREAIEYRELGEVPIRVEAVNMAKGGVDAGAFGYYATLLHDAGGLADVTIAAA